MPWIYLIGFLLIVGLVVTYWYVALLVAGAYLAVRIARYIRMQRYFSSDEFQAAKTAVAEVVHEHNDVEAYVAEIENSRSFTLGRTSAGRQAHLATFQNVSKHRYRRDRNVANYASPNVHNCSLQVVRNAKADPMKYLMKYFALRPDEKVLVEVETLGESISRLEEAVGNLRLRERDISEAVHPPAFILKHYERAFMEQVGVRLSPVTVPYPVYEFQYVSAGGNSAQTTQVILDTPAIDALVETLSQKIKWRKSAAGQRALMTAKLRDTIKSRDGFACCFCGIGVKDEPHLLLEVDHVTPVSRGGLSVPENLQTLCWRCNRTKSNKLVTSEGAD